MDSSGEKTSALQDSLFTDEGGGDDSLISAIARTSPKLAAKVKGGGKLSPERRATLERIIRTDSVYGERSRKAGLHVRPGEDIRKRLDAFLEAYNHLRLDKTRVIEVALDDLLSGLGF